MRSGSRPFSRLLCVAVLAGAAAAPAAADERRVVFGQSVEGRKLVAERSGERGGRPVLVVGEIHGDEDEGREVVKALRRSKPPRGVELWTVLTINPDGHAAGERRNARGVDLNRNFGEDWSGEEPPSSGYYAGPEPFSEPESRAVKRLTKRIRPEISVWYHQPYGAVLLPEDGPEAIHRDYARVARMPLMPFDELGFLPGTAINWQGEAVGGIHFVVEFEAGELADRAVARQVRAVGAVSRIDRVLPAD